MLGFVCDGCYKPPKSDKALQVCSSCKMASYCSRDCQTKDWKAHRPYCKGGRLVGNAERLAQTLQNSVASPSAMQPNAHEAADRSSGLGVTLVEPSRIPSACYDGKAVPGGYTACALSNWMKGPISRQSGFPRPVPSPASPAHQLVDIPGSGVGMCAMRPLVAGDLIYAERPLIALPVKWHLTSAPPSGATHEELIQQGWNEREELLKEMVALLPPERQVAYRALANSHMHDGSGPLAGVFRTNGFGLELDTWREIIPDISDRADHETTISGVCDALSRINHSCCPNADVYFDMPSFSFVLNAVRDIPAGTEITVGYCDVMGPVAERQKDLSPYGFTCTCSACAFPTISDPRRAKIAAASVPDPQFIVRMWLMNALLPNDYVIQDSQRVIRLMEEEGLQSERSYARHFAVLAMAYAALGKRENYLQAREKVATLGKACNPVRGRQLMKSLPEVPEQQEFWGMRLSNNGRVPLPSTFQIFTS